MVHGYDFSTHLVRFMRMSMFENPQQSTKRQRLSPSARVRESSRIDCHMASKKKKNLGEIFINNLSSYLNE